MLIRPYFLWTACLLKLRRCRTARIRCEGQHVSLGASNIGGMKAGAGSTNKLVRDLTALTWGVKAEADRVTLLALQIEARDVRDASRMRLQR